MNEAYLRYLSQIKPAQPDWVLELQEQAEKDHIPIMESDGMDVLLQLLRIHQPRSILEIGTATGYSALCMANELLNAHITTIEKNSERHQEALRNIRVLNMNEHITALHGDAIEVLKNLEGEQKFDFVFIDAAKGHYKNYFEQSANLLTTNGMIVSDNVLFRGLVYENADIPKRFRHIVKQLHHFNQWLMANTDFHTVILPSGDGLALSIKKS